MKHIIVPDEPSTEIPHLGWEDYDELNRLTVYQRASLESGPRACGCFHCGSRFSSDDIVAWMPEEDGEDTALCPSCGCDAVIFGTEKFPLTTSLLSALYMKWFSEEYKERVKTATYVPSFGSYEEYLRLGAPFLTERRAEYEVVGEMELFGVFSLDNTTGFMHEDTEAWAVKRLADGDGGGLIDFVIHEAERAFRCGDEGIVVGRRFELVNEQGLRLPHELWSPRDELCVRDLVERHGQRAKGLIPNPNERKMRLIIVHE